MGIAVSTLKSFSNSLITNLGSLKQNVEYAVCPDGCFFSAVVSLHIPFNFSLY